MSGLRPALLAYLGLGAVRRRFFPQQLDPAAFARRARAAPILHRLNGFPAFWFGQNYHSYKKLTFYAHIIAGRRVSVKESGENQLWTYSVQSSIRPVDTGFSGVFAA